MYLLNKIPVVAFVVLASLSYDVMFAQSQEQPFVECRENGGENDYILLSATPETKGVFLYSSNHADGLADQVARQLKVGDSADSLTLKVAPSVFCELHSEASTIGIETIRCTIGKGSSLKIHPTGGQSPDVNTAIAGGTLMFHRNMFYEGVSQLKIDLVTADGRGVSVVKKMQHQDCRVVGSLKK
jgi:hypothetical protein